MDSCFTAQEEQESLELQYVSVVSVVCDPDDPAIASVVQNTSSSATPEPQLDFEPLIVCLLIYLFFIYLLLLLLVVGFSFISLSVFTVGLVNFVPEYSCIAFNSVIISLFVCLLIYLFIYYYLFIYLQ